MEDGMSNDGCEDDPPLAKGTATATADKSNRLKMGQ
jgi:hypothetical protein